MDDPDGSYAPQSPDLSAYHSGYPLEPAQPSYYPQQQQTYQQQPYLPPSNYDQYTFGPQTVQTSDQFRPRDMPKGSRPKHSAEDDEWNPPTSARETTSNGKRQKIEVDCDVPAPGVAEGIEVKTKFPVARIKRIMQADEDVGKVAQVTPTAVSKALELFMISVITKSAHEARATSAKRVTATHLRNAILKEKRFDFLYEMAKKVPDASAPKKDDDSEEAAEAKKRKSAPRKRKKESDAL